MSSNWFNTLSKQGKEVAVHVDKLPEGTVKFEDVSSMRYQGTVDRPLSKSAAKRQNDPLHGKIVFTLPDNEDVEEEIVFSERDLQGDFSLRAGDVVEFNIAVGGFWLLHPMFASYKIKREVCSNGMDVMLIL